MNFQSLKWMIDSVIKSYKCPECASEVNESNIDIIWAAWTTINIDVECYNCGKHSMIKTEVVSIDLSNKWLNPELLDKLKKWFINMNRANLNPWVELIKDQDIVNLNKEFKKDWYSVSDLLWENN